MTATRLSKFEFGTFWSAQGWRGLIGLTTTFPALFLLCSCGGDSDSELPSGDSTPVAVAQASRTSGEAPLEIEFTGSDSLDPDGDLVSFVWDFGDGSRLEHGESTRHVYLSEGVYLATLTVLDARGSPDVTRVEITVLAAGCPDFSTGVRTGAVESSSLVEASGIVASSKNPNIYWVHNDSGDSARVFALDEQGAHLGAYTIAGATARDWEDIAVGPGPEEGDSYIYIGDIGDNARARSYVVVYRVAEPDVDLEATPGTFIIDGADRLEMTYSEGASDAECLLVDPRSGDIVIVTKRSDGRSRVYINPFPQTVGQRVSLQSVATMSFGTGELPGSSLVTAGDMSPAGNWILLRTYSHAFLWRRQGDSTVGQALTGSVCRVPAVSEPQGEAICFHSDGLGYFTVSEGARPPLYSFDLETAP